MFLERKVFKELKEISAGQAAYFRKHHKDVYIAMVCRQKKSDRKGYFIEETDFAMKILKDIEGKVV